MQNFSYENKHDLHENELVGESHFHKNSFALRLVLTQRQTRTRKWTIRESFIHSCNFHRPFINYLLSIHNLNRTGSYLENLPVHLAS